ncbi:MULTISPECIES: FAD-dependent oxidoreductase [unclassified Mesorhizobium]|uniref:FAD-dependent oxidoreductase n=1 Tax=unclassified Mesorhizobium TaxID=325217 RepID=UPI001126AD58|nr:MULTISPECIES: FAD-dependent oxidoreductase [unclassified Mesorhizobium]MBZ9894509.1 FAD-dependent oxidoreductase [Mesorhizobium sp. BR1-1-6]TPM57552.1 FAD-dependent oxidoreductase [Mesorhizobium sp. B2-2-4]TPM65645.1 FAD-dependent oxidoreductase [Mesorhizobium sp. B2-2-1]TPN38444.1 FAD-dependent oxidoreductase [Mesorhizobium sp. B1-1-6]TPN71971.1 FAD-dependent oxidoreductase [Mesorhizobium sp. B1-1-3]
MPLRLLKYGFSRDYPVTGDIPRTPELKPSYDVVIVGGGGHGLACAHYLSKYHGITDIAVLEKGYLAGGNTARNTTTIRSNYITQEGIAFYKEGVSLFETMSQELDFNVMFSQRGQLTLAHTEATLRAFDLRAEMGKHMGTRTEVIDAKEVEKLVPELNMDRGNALEILGGLWHADGGTARHDAVAWGYAAQASRRGVEIHQRTEVQGFEVESGNVRAVMTNRGRVACGAVLIAAGGMNYDVAMMAGVELPIRCYPLQAMVTQPLKPWLHTLVSSVSLHTYLVQSSRGEVVIGGGSDPYQLYSTRSTLGMKEHLAEGAVHLFPFLQGVRLLRQWAGITDMTPDYSPIMGASPLANLWLDCGWGTWGFKATAVAGKRMAETIAKGRAPDLLKPFALERFETFRLLNEMGATAASH